jgi:hypothetical protein
VLSHPALFSAIPIPESDGLRVRRSAQRARWRDLLTVATTHRPGHTGRNYGVLDPDAPSHHSSPSWAHRRGLGWWCDPTSCRRSRPRHATTTGVMVRPRTAQARMPRTKSSRSGPTLHPHQGAMPAEGIGLIVADQPDHPTATTAPTSGREARRRLPLPYRPQEARVRTSCTSQSSSTNVVISRHEVKPCRIAIRACREEITTARSTPDLRSDAGFRQSPRPTATFPRPGTAHYLRSQSPTASQRHHQGHSLWCADCSV